MEREHHLRAGFDSNSPVCRGASKTNRAAPTALFYSNEIATVAEYGKYEETKLNPQEVKLAEQLVQSLAADFNPKEYRDEFQERLQALIEAKLKGRSIAAAPEAPRAPVIDIMQALKKSLAATNKQEAARPEVSRPAPAAVDVSDAKQVKQERASLPHSGSKASPLSM
jgi:DNA end-binding protein Ku